MNEWFNDCVPKSLNCQPLASPLKVWMMTSIDHPTFPGSYDKHLSSKKAMKISLNRQNMSSKIACIVYRLLLFCRHDQLTSYSVLLVVWA